MKDYLLRAFTFLYKYARWFWSAPIGLPCLLLVPLFKALGWIDVRLPDHPDAIAMYRCQGRLAQGIKSLSFSGVTIGWVSFLLPDVSDRLVEHEMSHISDLRLWGPLYLVAYLVGFGVGAVKAWQSFPWFGLVNFLYDAYALNPFEVKANERARKN